MNDIRAKFEEIWPVPLLVVWSEVMGYYWPDCEEEEVYFQEVSGLCEQWDARLDTFARCQETTDVYVSLVEELVAALDHHWTELPDCVNKEITGNLVAHAKQIMEQKK